MSKATNVSKQAKRPSKVFPGVDQSVAFCVAAFADYLIADTTLQNAKALWDAARAGLRVELARAYKFIEAGRAWDKFKAQLRAALVKAKVCATPKDAGRLIDNQLIALSITGNGTRKGGKRKGAGRKETTATGEAHDVTNDAAKFNAAALAYIANAQSKHAGDDEMLETLGELAAILAGKA